MPIEIKELHIKINVADDKQTNASKDKQAGGKGDNILQDVLEQVFTIQERKQER